MTDFIAPDSALIMSCPFCHALVIRSEMPAHDNWHMTIARLLKEAGAQIEIRV